MGANLPVSTTQSRYQGGIQAHLRGLHKTSPTFGWSERIPAHGHVVDGCSFPPEGAGRAPPTPGRKVTGVRDKNSAVVIHDSTYSNCCLNNSWSRAGRGGHRDGERWRRLGRRQKPSLAFRTPQDCAQGLPGFTSLLHSGGYGVKRQHNLTGTFSTSYPLEKTGIKHLAHRGPGLEDLQRNRRSRVDAGESMGELHMEL